MEIISNGGRYMSLSHTLLGLLSYKPMTGYQIKQYFESSINHFWNAHMSQIYRKLNRMEKEGWLTFQIEPQVGKPDKKIYAITQNGTATFMRWLQDFPENSEETTRSEFLARIFFASRINLTDLEYELRRFVRKQHDQLNAYREIEDYIRKQQESGDGEAIFWHMTLRRGIKSVESDIEWAEECLQLVKDKATKGE